LIFFAVETEEKKAMKKDLRHIIDDVVLKMLKMNDTSLIHVDKKIYEM